MTLMLVTTGMLVMQHQLNGADEANSTKQVEGPPHLLSRFRMHLTNRRLVPFHRMANCMPSLSCKGIKPLGHPESGSTEYFYG